MLKKLSTFGYSKALFLDKPLLGLIGADDRVSISVEGRKLIIEAPKHGDRGKPTTDRKTTKKR